MKIRLGVDVACRAAHQASCADEAGRFLWSGHRFRTDPAELNTLWAKLPDDAEVTVIMEPTRNAWVPLAAWFRRQGASVVLVPSEQSADLRAYYNKHAKSDRLDSKVLARLLLLHPDGVMIEAGIGAGDALKRAVKIRSRLVHRRTTSMQRLDCLLELLGPAWVGVLGSDMTKTAFRFLACYANPNTVAELGERELAEFLHRSSRGAWAAERAAAISSAARTTIALWGDDFDFVELAADIATEARLALGLCEEIEAMDKRIAVLYNTADPAGIVRSVPGVGPRGAPQILGRLGDPKRFQNLAGVRSYSGLVPRRDDSGNTAIAGGPTKAGDACLREALFIAADHARRIDPTLAQRYHRLMTVEGKHHNSALCHVATVLLTRIAACLRANESYQLRDIDGTTITEPEGRAIIAERYTITTSTRAARRTTTISRQPRRNERVTKEVAKRSKTPPVPTTA